MQEGSLFSTPSPAFIVCRFFDDGRSDWCEVIPHHSFDLYFFNNECCRASFHVFISHLYVFFGEMSVSVLYPLFNWVVCFSGIELHKLLVYFWRLIPLSLASFFLNSSSVKNTIVRGTILVKNIF